MHEVSLPVEKLYRMQTVEYLATLLLVHRVAQEQFH